MGATCALSQHTPRHTRTSRNHAFRVSLVSGARTRWGLRANPGPVQPEFKLLSVQIGGGRSMAVV